MASIQEKVNQLKEELTRAEDELRAADSRDKGELTGVDQKQQTAIDTLTRTVTTLTTRVSALEAKANAKPAPPALPQRQTKERNQDYYPRVEAWPKKVGKSAPPKPTFGESSATTTVEYSAGLVATGQGGRIALL